MIIGYRSKETVAKSYVWAINMVLKVISHQNNPVAATLETQELLYLNDEILTEPLKRRGEIISCHNENVLR